jgi:hypothetical protein
MVEMSNNQGVWLRHYRRGRGLQRLKEKEEKKEKMKEILKGVLKIFNGYIDFPTVNQKNSNFNIHTE